MAHLVGVSDRSGFTQSSSLYNSNAEFNYTFTAVASGTSTHIGIKLADWWTATSAIVAIRNISGAVLGSATFTTADGVGEVLKAMAGVNIVSGTQYILSLRINTGYLKPSHNSSTYQLLQRTWTAAYPTLDNPATGGTTTGNGNIAFWVEGSTGPTVGTIGTDDEVIQGETGVPFQTTNATGTVTSVTIGGVTQTVTDDVSV